MSLVSVGSPIPKFEHPTPTPGAIEDVEDVKEVVLAAAMPKMAKKFGDEGGSTGERNARSPVEGSKELTISDASYVGIH